MQHRKALVCVASFTLLASSAFADDWPQYLGPTRNSISPRKGLLRSWPEKGPEVLWTVPVGRGFGGDKLPFWAITQCPLVYGDLLIVASQAPQAGVVAYEKLTGNVKWKTQPLGLISYVSPAIVKVDGKDHVVMVTGSTNPFQRT